MSSRRRATIKLRRDYAVFRGTANGGQVIDIEAFPAAQTSRLVLREIAHCAIPARSRPSSRNRPTSRGPAKD